MSIGMRLLVLSFLIVALSSAPTGHGQEQQRRSAADEFARTLEAHGIDAAVARFHEMRTDAAGAWDFSEDELMLLGARRLPGQGMYAEALELLKLAVDVFPDSAWAWYELGMAFLQRGNRELAVCSLEKCAVLAPDDPDVDWTLRNIDVLLHAAGMMSKLRGKHAPGENMGVTGPYLGQPPPGPTPRVFAPGIVASSANEYSIAFSPDGREIYFSRSGEGVLVCRWEEEGWTAPEVIRLSGGDADDEPNLTPDGQSILFNARREVDGRPVRFIHVAPRQGGGWGEARCLFQGMYATAARDGAIYYTGTAGRPDFGVIVRRPLTDEGYGEPEKLGGGVNTDRIDAHPFIAPDASFILFDSDRDGGHCLFICFCGPDGAWGRAINLNDRLDIPRLAGQCCLSPDGKHLFYSYAGDMWWVSAAFIEDLRREEAREGD